MTTYDYIIKKYNLNVGSQYVTDIPNMDRNDLAGLFAELGFNNGAEVGVENGIYSEILCRTNPILHLWSIDPWLAEAYEPGGHAIDTEQEKYDARYEDTVKRLSPYNCTIVRKASLMALDGFKDGSLDFVYIDANHDFTNFTNDLHNWIKKVKPGGIVSGHDYAYFSFKKANHVKRALQAYSRCYRMIPLFIVGAMEYKDGWKRDKYRSWFYVKP